MLKKLKLWSGGLALVFLAAGCASTVHIEKDDNANFSEYKTFAWIDKDGEGKADRNRGNDLTEQKIRTAISNELEKTAGWREVKSRDNEYGCFPLYPLIRNVSLSANPDRYFPVCKRHPGPYEVCTRIVRLPFL